MGVMDLSLLELATKCTLLPNIEIDNCEKNMIHKSGLNKNTLFVNYKHSPDNADHFGRNPIQISPVFVVL